MAFTRTSLESAAGRAALLLIFALTMVFAGSPLPDGPAFLLEDGAERPAAAMSHEGLTAFAWVRSAAPRDVRVQVFGRDGLPVAPPLTANEPSELVSELAGPDVAFVGEGEAVLVWPVSGDQIGRRIGADGAPVGESWPAGFRHRYNDTTPGLGAAPNGRFVLGRVNGYFADYAGDVLGRAYDETGAPIDAGTVLCWNCGPYRYDSPDAGSAGNGDYVIVWRSWAEGVRARLAAPDGSFRADVKPDPWGYDPRVVMRPEGEFLVAWTSEGPTGLDPPSIVVRLFDAGGVPIGPEIPVAETRYCTWLGQYDAEPIALAQDGEGNFVVTYTDQEQPSGTCQVYARQFRADGTPDGPPFRVDESGAALADVEAAMDADGNLGFAWPQGGGVYARRFCGPLRAADPLAVTVCEGQRATFETSARGRDPFTYQWTQDGTELTDAGNVSGAHGALLTLDPVTAADAGAYACVVADGCATRSERTTAAATLTVTPLPASVGGLLVTRPALDTLHFAWTDTTGTSEYVVREDTTPIGAFGTVTGTASSGANGLDAPLPDGNRFYLVRGRNACGEGP